jgi:hypothetical protein
MGLGRKVSARIVLLNVGGERLREFWLTWVVGDPIEATALHAVFGEGRTARQPLFVGSVKSNIGHLEGASGVVSVIKSAMMLEKGFVLPNCNFEKGNPKIPFAEWNLKVCFVSFLGSQSKSLERSGRG